MKRMKFRSTCLLIFFALALNAYAQAPVNLGTAGNFEVLAGTGITSADAGTTIKGGDVGSSPNPAITGLLPVQVIGGTLYLTAPLVAPAVTTAKGDLVTAYNDAFGRGCTETIASGEIGSGATPVRASLGPGVYCFTSTATLIGTLTLAGTGSGDVWIFKIGSALLTATGATVAFSGGASPCNVFWQVTSSATIETGNSFAGVIMALTSITLNGGTLNGRALARNGSVTISGSETIINACSGGSSTGTSIVVSPVTSSIVCASGSSITKTAVVLLNGVPEPNASVIFTVSGADSFTSLPILTNASGIATFTFTPSGPDSVVASIGTVSSNTTFATCSGTPGDVCPASSPTVTVLSVTSGPLKQVIFSILAPGGLSTVIVDTATNATVAISSFDRGTILTVGVTATKINPSVKSVIGLTVIDLCGNATVFDPVFATITIPASRWSRSHRHAGESDAGESDAGEFDFRHREVGRFNGIGHTEGIVLLQNDTPGVDSVVIRVNGSEFRTHLADGQAKKIDISSALYHGSNTVTIVAFGHPNSSVDLSISDGK